MAVIEVLNRTSRVDQRYHLTDEWPRRGVLYDNPDAHYSIRLGSKANCVYGCSVGAFFKQEPGDLDDPDALAAAQRKLVTFLHARGYAPWLRRHGIQAEGTPASRRRWIAHEATTAHGRCERAGVCLEHAVNPDVEACR